MAEGEARGIARVEAFSDGVIAIIVTIMVLELKAPAGEGLGHVLALWPVFLAYLLSYVYVGLYWGNHHRLLGHARVADNALIWSNLAFLFGLSLVPFATAYLDEHLFDRASTLLYLAVLLLPAIGYGWLQRVIRRNGAQHEAALAYHRGSMRKAAASTVIYLAGAALTFIAPPLGLGCAMLVALLWFLPDARIDRVFAR